MRINGHVMRRLGLSRRDLFASIEQPALRPLPETDYEFAEWRLARIGPDNHVEFDGFFYSVPHALIRAQVDMRITSRTIEVFHRAERVAAHERRYAGGRHGTPPEHMPSSHRRYAEWAPARFHRWARSIGPNTEGLVVAILANRPHPEQGFRTCLGIPHAPRIHSFTIYRRSRNPRPSKIAGIAFSIRAVRVPDCFAPAK